MATYRLRMYVRCLYWHCAMFPEKKELNHLRPFVVISWLLKAKAAILNFNLVEIINSVCVIIIIHNLVSLFWDIQCYNLLHWSNSTHRKKITHILNYEHVMNIMWTYRVAYTNKTTLIQIQWWLPFIFIINQSNITTELGIV